MSRGIWEEMHPGCVLGEEHFRTTRAALIDSVGPGKDSAPYSAVPFYHVVGQDRACSVGVDASCASACLALYHARTKKAPQTPDAAAGRDTVERTLRRLAAQAVGWAEARRVSHSSPASVHEHFRRLDRAQARREEFDAAIAQLHGAGCAIERFVALDIEAYELAQRKLTEVGVAVYDRRLEWLEAHHIVVREHRRLRNRRFAPDARDEFAFGESVRMSSDEAMAFVTEQLAAPRTALVGHALLNDLRFLRRAKLSSSRSRVDEALLDALPKYDLQRLYQARERTERQAKLADICAALGVAEQTMHNAGNDAALTLTAFLRLLRLAPNQR